MKFLETHNFLSTFFQATTNISVQNKERGNKWFKTNEFDWQIAQIENAPIVSSLLLKSNFWLVPTLLMSPIAFDNSVHSSSRSAFIISFKPGWAFRLIKSGPFVLYVHNLPDWMYFLSFMWKNLAGIIWLKILKFFIIRKTNIVAVWICYDKCWQNSLPEVFIVGNAACVKHAHSLWQACLECLQQSCPRKYIDEKDRALHLLPGRLVFCSVSQFYSLL